MSKFFATSLILALSGLGLFCCSPNGSGRLFVEHDYSYEGHFKDYRSFNFLECEFIDSTLLCSDIQDAIRHQMEARGYRVSNRSPNLLVSYNIFRSDLRFRGYQQPVIKDWVVREDDDATYKRIDYNLDEGTLMISLIDAESYQVIWKGYASKMLRNQNFKNNYFKGIVRSIFDQYPLMATTSSGSGYGR